MGVPLSGISRKITRMGESFCQCTTVPTFRSAIAYASLHVSSPSCLKVRCRIGDLRFRGLLSKPIFNLHSSINLSIQNQKICNATYKTKNIRRALMTARAARTIAFATTYHAARRDYFGERC